MNAQAVNPARHLTRQQARDIMDQADQQRAAAVHVLELNTVLLQLLTGTVALLIKHQWAAIGPTGQPSCPECDQSEDRGHRPDCELMLALDADTVANVLEGTTDGG